MEMMKEMAAREGSRKPPILPEAKVARLREFAETYAKPCPFKAGDLVTPRVDSAIRGHGEPHLVLEVLDSPSPVFVGEVGSNSFGKRLDIRVASISNSSDAMPMHWVESVEFVPWEEASAAQEAKAA